MKAPIPKQQAELSWIAVDWGTSNFRAWGFDKHDRLLCQSRSDKGMSKLKQNEFEGALTDAVEDWLVDDRRIDVFACGMVGAKQGWVEAPYSHVPCDPTTTVVEAPTSDKRFRVHILSGVSQSSPCDVMRGEETQLAGYLSEHPNWTGTICLPGSHSKWVRIENGRLIAFHTYMTGELYAALKTSTVLRYAMSSNDLSIDVFDDAVKEVLEQPAQAASQFFKVRATDLLTNTAPGDGSSQLSGNLIAMELASVCNKWSLENVVLIGEIALCRRYKRALHLAGVRCSTQNAESMSIAGLCAARKICLAA